MSEAPSQSSKRRNARRFAMQALYSCQFEPITEKALLLQFIDEHDMSDTDLSYFSEMVSGALRHVDDIDALIEANSTRKLQVQNPVELAVLRLAVYELKYRLDIPYKVVINEALELTKAFGANDGYKYVNGVLDKLRVSLRLHG